MSNPQAQNALVLSLKTTHQMDDSAIKNISESDIFMSRKQEELFCALAFKSVILRCFLLNKSLILRKLSDATEMLQHTRNKLEILAITYAQVYTKILYIIDKQFNDWVQSCILYPTNLDAIYLEVIDFRDNISNINNIYFHPVPLSPSFRTFDTIDTKTTKGSGNNDHSGQPSKTMSEKAKDPKFKMNPHLANGDSETSKS